MLGLLVLNLTHSNKTINCPKLFGGSKSMKDHQNCEYLQRLGQ